jgi:uncharacterized protein (TIGR00266 family)
MQSEILYHSAYALLKAELEPGEEIQAEAGAMVSMSSNVEITTKARGGFLSGLKRAVLGGESFFINTFTCARGRGEVTFAPSLPGDLMHVPMDGGTLLVQSGSYIASTPGIEIDTAWGGARGFFSGEGLFLLKCSGHGDLFVSSYGAIHGLELPGAESYVVDTGHMVAFEGSVSYKVRPVGGLKQTFFSGEGLVCDFSGPGRLYIQTRSFQSFVNQLIPYLPRRKN